MKATTILINFLIYVNVLKLCHCSNSHRVREEIVVKNVTVKDNFSLNYTVINWSSLCEDEKCYVAGLMEKSVVIVEIQPNLEHKVKTLDFESKLVEIKLFSHWNSTTKSLHSFLVVGQEAKVSFINLKEAERPFWTWQISKAILHLNFFEIEHKKHILLATAHNNQTSADLYKFSLQNSPNFWLKQQIPQANPFFSSALTETGPHYFLALPQTDKVHIYKQINNHFELNHQIISPRVNEVLSFQVGYKSFLTFNGFHAGIYRFQAEKDEIVTEERLENGNLDGVHYWLPIALRTEKEETILLAQRILHHDLHQSFVVELITYDGLKFEEHEDVPCSYFGEVMHDLTCLAGEESKNGFVGAAPLVMDGFLGVLVPREGHSELFQVEISRKMHANPILKEIEEIRKSQKYLDRLMAEQEKEIAKMRQSNNGEVSAEKLKTQIEKLKAEIDEIQEKMNETPDGTYEKIIFSNDIEILGTVSAQTFETSTISERNAKEFLNDIVLKSKIDNIPSSKTFVNLQADDLVITQTINDKINAEDLLFDDNNNIVFTGTLSLDKPAQIMHNLQAENINDMNVSAELIQLNQPISEELVFLNLDAGDNLSVEKMNNLPLISKRSAAESADEIFIPHNLQVGNLNGEDFNAFLGQICMKNLPTFIPELQVQGDVTVLHDAHTDFLNNLQFPSSFVMQNQISKGITGQKVFTSEMLTSELHCEQINNVIPEEMITLSTNQHITGTVTFNQTEATEFFDFLGNVSGHHPNKFLQNPNITTADHIKANVHFQHLEVEGDIILQQNLNGANYLESLQDIVYKTEDQPQINAAKTFTDGLTVLSNLEVESNSINDISLDEIVTLDTEQELNVTVLNGNVNFGDVFLPNGLYNGVNVTKLDQESVKLTGDQYISSAIIFNEPLEVLSHLDIENLTSLSNDKIDLIKNTGNFNESASLSKIEADRIFVQGDFKGQIHNFDLENFDTRRLSATRDQHIQNLEVQSAKIKSFELENKLNGVSIKDLQKESLKNKILVKIAKGEIYVENLFAKGPVRLEKVDNKSAANLGGSLWKNNSFNISELILEDLTEFESIEIDQLSDVNFENLLKNIYFKPISDITLNGNIKFSKGLHVKKFIETNKLNSIPIEDILTKFGQQTVNSPLVIHGNLHFGKDLNISSTLNGVSIDNLKQQFQMEDDGYRVFGDLLFNRLAHIDKLQVDGFVNNKKLQEHLDSIVFTNQDGNLTESVTFANNVRVDGNLRILDKVNKINLPEFVSNMVLITKDEKIEVPVHFTAAVNVTKQLHIAGNLNTKLLNNIKIESLTDEAVFIDQGYLPGNFIFENVQINQNLRTDFLNSIDLSTLIPLRTKQFLNTTLNFDEVDTFNDISVGNATNSLNLTKEFENTVLLNTNDAIESDLEFSGSVFVNKNVELFGLVNEQKLENVVTTNTDQNLSGTYDFKSKTLFENDIILNSGLINGINFTQWSVNQLQLRSKTLQNVEQNWTVLGDLVFESDVKGNGLINGRNLEKFRNELEEKRRFKYSVERDAIETYKNICKDLSHMHDRLKKQIYKFNYFEMMDKLEFKHQINYVHHFKLNKNYYLLVNERKQCHSHLFKFTQNQFQPIEKIQTGQIEQVIQISAGKNMVFLAMRNGIGCEVGGTNLFQAVEDDLIHLARLEDLDLLQDSLIPSTFYGVSNGTVVEYRMSLANDAEMHKYRQWSLKQNNLIFVPRGLGTGPAMRSPTHLIYLDRTEDDSDEFDNDPSTQSIINGAFSSVPNVHLPSATEKSDDFTVISVGRRSSKRHLLAAATHEETSVKGSVDFIKIYEDVVSGKVFDKIPTYKPSALTSVEFNNGEALLIFLENENRIQVYEYKGIEGFKHKAAMRVKGNKLIAIKLPLAYNGDEMSVVGVLNGNRLSLLKAVMLGNRIDENLKCVL